MSSSPIGRMRLARPIRSTWCFSLLLLAGAAGAVAQVRFSEHLVSAPLSPWAVFAIDLDRDGDVDVISGDGGGVTAESTLYWYENDGLVPPSFTQRAISTGRDTSYIYATDLDGDGDVDIAVATSAQGQINWYENEGGWPPTFTRHLVDGSASFAGTVHAADVDSDGNVDLLAASSGANRFTIYRSDGGSPPQFRAWLNWPTSVAYVIQGADLDGDGDTDVLTGANVKSSTISWWENLGDHSPGFERRTVASGFGGVRSLVAADLDADDDVDVLSASLDDNTIAWHENDGLLPPSFSSHLISTTAFGAFSVFAADVDGDGDTDVLSASLGDNKIAWYENDGQLPPSFTEHVISTDAENANAVFAIDVDGDGDTGVLSASRGPTPFTPGEVVWYEHLLSLSVVGGCPGQASLRVSGGPPQTEVGVLAATANTGFTKTGTLCNGTEFEIGGELQLPPTWIGMNEAGFGEGPRTLVRRACWLEAIALANCATSGAVLVEP